MKAESTACVKTSPDGTAAWVCIDELDFSGNFVKSADGHYFFAWDHLKEQHRVALVRDRSVVWFKEVNDCWHGAVANNGTAAWLYGIPEECVSDLCICDMTGAIVYRDRIPYAYYVAVAPEGDLFCYNTKRSEPITTPKTEVIRVFAILNREVRPLFETRFDGYKLDGITVAEQNFIITADGCRYVYASTGTLLNGLEVDYHNAKLAAERHDAPSIVNLAGKHLQQTKGHITCEERQFICWALSVAIQQHDASRTCRSKAARLLGELALGEGDVETARFHLKLALQINPKCGARTLLNGLETQTK